MWRFSIFLFLALVASLGCSRVEMLNMKPHTFAVRPAQIIWLQVPGLEEEHLAMLRFSMPDATKTTALEQSLCVGKAWSFNFYELRPSPYEGTLAQILGSKNIKGTCEDLDQRPVWSYLKESGHMSAILEAGAGDDWGLSRFLACGEEGREFLADTTYVSMSKAKTADAPMFHYQAVDPLSPGLYYDKTCQQGNCFASVLGNAQSLFKRFTKDKKNWMFIVRYFGLYRALSQGKTAEVRESLAEIDKLVAYFRTQVKADEGGLILLTSSAAKHVEMPKQGKEWAQFEKSGKNVAYRRTALIAPIFASGALSENFCGIYNESDVVERLLTWPRPGQLRPLFPFAPAETD